MKRIYLMAIEDDEICPLFLGYISSSEVRLCADFTKDFDATCVKECKAERWMGESTRQY